jgi:uncharacterized membrane protein
LAQSQTLRPITPTALDLGDIFRRTWSIFKEQWGACLVGWLIFFALTLVISYGLAFGGMLFGRFVFGPREAAAFSHVGNVVAQLVLIWLGIGMAIYFLKIARGQPAEIGDLFSGGPYYLRIFLATLLFLVVFYVGLALCIVPGVILGLMFSQYYYLVLDRRLPVFDAFRQSKELMKGNKMTLFLIGLAALGIFIIAMIPCCLGLFVVGPWFSLMAPVVYLAVTGQPTAPEKETLS